MKYPLRIFFGLVFLLLGIVLFLRSFTDTKPAFAEGGRNNECEDAQAKGVTTGIPDAATYTALGNTVTGVCIKAGSTPFSDGHSEQLTNGTYWEGCYTITGVGTQTVTVVRNADTNVCQGISHIDVYYSIVPTLTPTPTPDESDPTPTPTPDESEPTPTPTESQTTPTPTVTPTPPTNIGGPGGSTSGSSSPPVCVEPKPDKIQVSLTVLNATTIRLQWNASPKADSYVISYGTTSGQYSFGVTDTGNVTSYDIGSLDLNQTYYFVVYAKNGCAIGDPSNEVSKTRSGAVLGTSTKNTGKVLGASTMAKTGIWDWYITLFLAAVGLGSITTAIRLHTLFLRKSK